MKVRLPNATIGVRGTALAGEAKPDGAANLVLLGLKRAMRSACRPVRCKSPMPMARLT